MEGKKADIAYDSKILLELEKLGNPTLTWKPNFQVRKETNLPRLPQELPEKIKFTLLRAGK